MMREHGTFELRRSGQVMLIRFRESWNLETALRYSRCVIELAEQMGPDPWCTLADLRGWAFGTPESTIPVTEASRKIDKLGRTHVAVIVDRQELQQVVADRVIKGRDKKRLPVHFFYSAEEAQAWVREMGFEFSPD
jgi:hypothetical protein